MRIVFEREFKALFRNIRAVVCITLLMAASGVFLLLNSLLTGYSGIQPVFSNMSLAAALAIPPVAATAINSEKKKETDQFLCALPVTRTEVVVGKFLAILAFFMIPNAVMALYPLALAILGASGAAQGYVILLMFIFAEAFFIALSLMLSAFFKEQWLAMLIAYAANVILFVLGMISVLFGGAVEYILKWISPFRRFDPIVFDLFDLTSILFYASFAVLFLALTVMKIGRSNASVIWTKKKSIICAVMAAIILCGNMGASMLPIHAMRLDVSTNKLYGVSKTTKEYLNTLDEEVTVYLLNPSSAEEKLHSFIKRYCALSDKITLKEIDTTKQTDFLSKYSLSTTPSLYSMIIESDRRYKLVDSEECFAYYYEGDNEYLLAYLHQYLGGTTMSPSQYMSCGAYFTQMYDYYKANNASSQMASAYEIIQSLAGESVYKLKAEAPITTAIEYVTADKIPTVYLVSNHGEKSTSANPLDISAGIPENATTLIINDPDSDYSEGEISDILKFSDRGGRLLIVTDSQLKDKTNLKRLIAAFGLSAEDEVLSINGSADVSAVTNSKNAVLAEVGTLSVAMSQVNAIIQSDIQGLELSPLLTVAAEKQTDENTDTAQQESEESTDKVIAMSVTKSTAPKLVWFTGGDSFVKDTSGMTEEEFQEYYYLLLLRNASLEWLKVSFASTLSFDAPKEYTAQVIDISTGAAMWAGVLFIGIMPIAVLSGSLLNRYVRKKRSSAAESFVEQ